MLVTDSHGYIGSVLQPELARAGHVVYGPDTFFYRGCDLGDPGVGVAAVRTDLELEWDARRGAEELVAAYRRVGLTADELDGRRYIRLRQLKHLLETGAPGGTLRWTTS